MAERFLEDDKLIVSKTDLKGNIRYGNDVFCEISDFSIEDILGKPHKIVRNPQMPSCIFKLLWDTIQEGNEIFAYVNNCGKTGDNYWVFAHVTPSYDADGSVIGYHSNRRKPSEDALSVIRPLYNELLKIESRFHSKKEAIEASMNRLLKILEEKGLTYEEFVLAL